MNMQSKTRPRASDTQASTGIAIQGFEGCFHQEAARRYFGEAVEVIPCNSFRQLIRTASDPSLSMGGIMAIENSIAGSIMPNYQLLQNSDLLISGEIYLHIRQNLLVNPGVSLQDIREVHSHPMALLQCIDFLEKYPAWKLVETEDTALSAKHIHQHKLKHTAAIAGSLAASLFQLDILVPDIHTLPLNYTRFLVLSRHEDLAAGAGANKASVIFQTDHSQGSLAKVLQAVAAHGINLSKLQSMPIPGTHFRYSFYTDMEFDTRAQLDEAIAVIVPMTEGLKICGIYKNGAHV